MPKMAIFCKENLSNSSKRCKLFSLALKEAFSICRTCNRRHLSHSSPDSEEETPTSDFDDVQELVMSMIRSRAMEATVRRKSSMITDGFSTVIHPISGELFIRTPKQESNKEDEEMEDFASVQSHFSHCMSAAADSEGFFTVKTNFSCCLSLKDIDHFTENPWWASEDMNSSELRRRAIIQEFCHCEGWPFGLCRKALLLPPLPKSPSDSWTWCKGTNKVVKTC